MNLLCTPSHIVGIKNPYKGLRNVFTAGYKNILLDFSLCCTSGELEQIGKKEAIKEMTDRLKVFENPEKMSEAMLPLLKQCEAQKVHMPAAYAPYLERNTKHDDLNGLLFQLAKESIKVCGQAGCKNLVIRPLFAGISSEDLWKHNKAYYLGLAELAREQDVCILLENQCKDFNGHLVRGACSLTEDARNWIDWLNETVGEERFGFCLDVGICNLCGQNMYDFITELGNRLKAVILRDCSGNRESAMLPFTSVYQGRSQTDWQNLIRGLREIGFDGELIMDMRDTISAFSHLLRPEILRLSKKIGDFLKWQIEMEIRLKQYSSRVLFGAGNMCRNYMKCYGKKYPPLFTCDNDRTVWDTEFFGLTVKNPRCLKELPEDCAIFICNIYYKEIREQILEMGIKNPIEYFNDEYMPSFYLERLPMKEVPLKKQE
ncbi:sugar phosphate isomerase/epimerase [Lachnospiraceae bacterium MD308]|nr:sugar phosphate isomerase/epimerase [Lachnospiraceae bacterium MD308]